MKNYVSKEAGGERDNGTNKRSEESGNIMKQDNDEKYE